jgi:DNA-directed RNA polymerase subunit beta
MLRSLDGKPFDVLLNPLALPSRVNTSALYELALGKLAAKTGQPIVLSSYTNKGSSRLKEVFDELEKNGISPVEEVFDPVSGKKLDKPVTTGMSYIYKLHHVVASKQSARGTGSYD